MRRTILERSLRAVPVTPNLTAVSVRTTKSKHMEYMNVAARIVLLVLVMAQPVPGIHAAVRRIPVAKS